MTPKQCKRKFNAFTSFDWAIVYFDYFSAIRSTLKPGFARSELTTSCNYFHFGDTFLTSILSQKCGFSSAF